MRTMRCKARARPGEFEFGHAGTGIPQVGVRIDLLDGELQGQIVTWYGYFTEKSQDRTLDQLEIAGWNGADGNDFVNLTGLGSTEFELQLEEEDDKDEQGNPAGTYWKPAFINRMGVAMRDKMDANAKLAFAAELRGAILSRKPRGTQPAQQRRAPAPGGTRPQTNTRAQTSARPQTQTGAQPGFGDDAPMPDDEDYL